MHLLWAFFFASLLLIFVFSFFIFSVSFEMKESLLLFSSFEKSFILYPETFACSSLINKHNIAREKPCALEDKP